MNAELSPQKLYPDDLYTYLVHSLHQKLLLSSINVHYTTITSPLLIYAGSWCSKDRGQSWWIICFFILILKFTIVYVSYNNTLILDILYFSLFIIICSFKLSNLLLFLNLGLFILLPIVTPSIIVSFHKCFRLFLSSV